MWYRNKAYTENWIAYHPEYGFLGVVDAHPQAVMYQGKPLRTRLQIRDASFNVEPVQSKTFIIGKNKVVLPAPPAVANFNDSQTYCVKNAPDAGLKLPVYGLKFRVLGHSPNGSVGRVQIYK